MNRVVLAALVLAAASRAHAAPPSNPAFLGISMPANPTPDPGCLVIGVTAGGAAEAAHLMKLDVIVGLEGVRVADCTSLTAQIIAHQPGDEISLDVLRSDVQVELHARLVSRAEVLQRRYVGSPLPELGVVDYDDGRELDLADLRGETRVLAWFDPACDGCAHLIERVAAKTKLLAITYGDHKDLESGRLTSKLGVPVELVPSATQFDAMAMNERDRAYFMVADCHGIVRFVAPIVPDADDADAAIDDVLASVDQTEHAHLR